KVAITQDRKSIEQAIHEALDPLDLDEIVRGKLVAIKPNETYATTKETKGVTQPDTLRAVIREVRRRKPRAVVVTGGSGAAETEDVMRASGMMKVIADEGVEFFDHNRAPFVDVELPYAPSKDVKGPQKSIKVNPRVIE